MLESNPNYLAFLEGLDPINKAQLLHGNWKVRATGNNYFKRENLIEVDKLPNDIIWARGWDLASQEITTQNKDCDFSAGIKIGKDRNGFYYLVGDYHRDNYDELLCEYGRFRKRPAERDDIIANQGYQDGNDCVIVLPVDPGAAGKVAYQELAKRLMSKHLRVRQDPMPTNKDKLTKFRPFTDAVEAGLVRIYTPSFDLKSKNSYFDELERFNGERSGRSVSAKDDRVDATATAFNYLVGARNHKVVERNQKKSTTLANNVLNEYDILLKNKR